MTDRRRKYDIVVFGASGVTGQYVVEELALHNEDLHWCIVGRNLEKLQETLRDVGSSINKDLNDIEIIIADVNDEPSLDTMCRNTHLVLNCVGPYRFFGEKVVELCIKNGTHHIDVSGEPQFLETIQAKYFYKAREQDIYIIGSCGFDSIPCDVGVETLRKKFGGDLHSVETYLKVNLPPGSTVNFATWQSAIYGLAHSDELKPVRKELKEKLFTKGLPKPDYPLKKRPLLFKSKEAKGWCIPFIGSDRAVVLRTQMYNYQFQNEKPVQIQTYMIMYSLFYALITLIMGGIFKLMTKFVMGRYLLERFPEIFSLGVFSRIPPVKEKESSGSFEIIFKAQGWSEKLLDPSDKHTGPPNKTVTAVLKGPDPRYITTAICSVSSAMAILLGYEGLPKGGVFTPGAVFKDTNLVEKLEKRGITIEILDP